MQYGEKEGPNCSYNTSGSEGVNYFPAKEKVRTPALVNF